MLGPSFVGFPNSHMTSSHASCTATICAVAQSGPETCSSQSGFLPSREKSADVQQGLQSLTVTRCWHRWKPLPVDVHSSRPLSPPDPCDVYSTCLGGMWVRISRSLNRHKEKPPSIIKVLWFSNLPSLKVTQQSPFFVVVVISYLLNLRILCPFQ